MFGANLRLLSQDYSSISELARQLGINRTQFNRYLSGESFPRPDVLERICTFFDVDARILLEPAESVRKNGNILTGSFLTEFTGAGVSNLPNDLFPNGFYRFSRRSFMDPNRFVIGLVYIFRDLGATYLRGYENREAMRLQGLPTTPNSREFRGYIARQEDGIVAVVARRKAMTCSFNYLSKVASFENNYWLGYVCRTVRESPESTRVERLVYEHLGTDRIKVMQAARQTGFCDAPDLIPFHAHLLQSNVPFR